MDVTVRAIEPAEFAAFAAVGTIAFGGTPAHAEHVTHEEPLLEYDRTAAAILDGRFVGTSAMLSFELTVPGGAVVQAGGLTWVSVLPDHRRRGVMRAMVAHQLAAAVDRGEVASILLATESSIYGRFGYGPATFGVTYEIGRAHARFASAPQTDGTVRLVARDEALGILPALLDQARRDRAGMLSRPKADWEYRIGDHPGYDSGPTRGARQDAVYFDGGAPGGYATYRYNPEWKDGQPGGEVQLEELITTTPAAYAALWRHCLELDLSDRTVAYERPPDEPLRFMLADPRRLRTRYTSEHLWVRLLDVPAALRARRYAEPGGLVLEVRDEFRPVTGGRFELDGGPDGATCRATTREPDLRLGMSELGAAYLGGAELAAMAWAGRVEAGTPEVLRRADAMFASRPIPWCNTDF